MRLAVVGKPIPKKIKRIIRDLASRMKSRWGQVPTVTFRMGQRREYPAHRNLGQCTVCAATSYVHCRGNVIVLAPKLTRRPIATIRAIIAHEIAHAVMRNYRHSERQCDAKAEQLFGIKIYYDKRDVQTTTYRRGYQRPRPLHLPK